MKIIVIGTGIIGAAVSQAARQAGHHVVTAARSSGDEHADTTDRASLDTLFARIGPFDAVASAAGCPVPSTWPRRSRDSGLRTLRRQRTVPPQRSQIRYWTRRHGSLH